MSREETDLATHVEICAIRYKRVEEKFDEVERRILTVENHLHDLKADMSSGFSEIKILLERNNSHRHTSLLATLGTIAVAVISTVGYYIVRH